MSDIEFPTEFEDRVKQLRYILDRERIEYEKRIRPIQEQLTFLINSRPPVIQIDHALVDRFMFHRHNNKEQ